MPWSLAREGLPFRRNAAFALLIGLFSVGVFALLGEHAPLMGDTCVDLGIARDCVDGARCAFHGCGTSIAGLRHGSLWIHLLTASLWLGLSARHIQLVVLGLHALSSVVLYLGVAKRVSPQVGAGAATLYLFYTIHAVHYPVLWNPSIAPLFLALLFVGTWRFVADGRWLNAVPLAIVAALAADAHLIHYGVTPLVAFLVVLAARRPLWTILAATALFAATLLGISRGALFWNVEQIARMGLVYLPGLLWLVAVVAGLVARRFESLRRPRAVVAATLLYALLFEVVLYVERNSHGQPFKTWYFLPFVPIGCVLVAAGIQRATDRCAALLRQRTKVLSRTQLLAWAYALVALYALAYQAEHRRTFGYWRLWEAEKVLGHLYARGRSFWELTVALQGPDRELLLQCGSSWEPSGQPQGSEPALRQEIIHLVKARPASSAPRAEPPPHVSRLPLDGDQAVLIESTAAWLAWHDAEICFVIVGAPPRRRACLTYPWARQLPRDMPTYFETRHHSQHISPSHEAQQLELPVDQPMDVEMRVPIRVRGSAPSRMLLILKHAADPWVIRSIEGVAYRKHELARWVELLNTGPADGMLVLHLEQVGAPARGGPGLVRAPAVIETGNASLLQAVLADPRER